MNNLDDLGTKLVDQIVNPAVLIFSSATFVWFLAGVVYFLYNSYGPKPDATKIEAGKTHMLWGLIGLFIIYSASAIFTFLYELFTVSP